LPCRACRGLLLAVRAPEDFEYLVNESEIVKGRPGRTFVVAGADCLAYRLQWHPLGSNGWLHSAAARCT
jgi:hypothetical protein